MRTPPTLSHIGIAVPDLEAAIEHFTARLGVPPGPVLLNEGQGVRLVQFDLGNARIELLSPLNGDSAVVAFLQRNPKGGLHHLAIAVDEVDHEISSCVDANVRILAPVSQNVFGRRIAFLHPSDMFGVLVEIEGL